MVNVTTVYGIPMDQLPTELIAAAHGDSWGSLITERGESEAWAIQGRVPFGRLATVDASAVAI